MGIPHFPGGESTGIVPGPVWRSFSPGILSSSVSSSPAAFKRGRTGGCDPRGLSLFSKSLGPAPDSSLSAAGCRTALDPVAGRAACSELARDLLVAGAGIRASKICARLSVRAALFICLYPPIPGGSKTSVNPTRGLRLSYCSTVLTREPFCWQRRLLAHQIDRLPTLGNAPLPVSWIVCLEAPEAPGF
jgi:hypothetical protein